MMNHFCFETRPRKLTGLLLVGLVGLLALSGLPSSATSSSRATRHHIADARPDQQPDLITNNYRQTNLVSDLPGLAQIQDPLLVNPWGIAQSATSPFWVANAGTSSATLYGGDVSGSPFAKNPLNVSIPPVPPPPPGAIPTGMVFSGSATDFSFTGGGSTGPARFIFAAINGTITAWKGGLTTAVVVASPAGRVYTGLAIGNNGTSNFLYAADFANKKIDVFDKNFALVTLAGSFTDPTLPSDYTPHNIQNLGGKLYVAYAKVDPVTHRDLPGPGNGYVSVFDTNGNLLGRLVSNGPLSSPWGLTIAPAGFGAFPGALLVGNFGDGRINCFNPTTGGFVGTLNDEAANPISIDGLWALTVGNGAGGGDTGTVYFSAGIAGENHGLLGSLKPSSPATTIVQFSAATYNFSETDGTNSLSTVASTDITVTRLGDISGASTVNYATFDGTATQGKDYLLAVGTLSFSAGQTSKTFTVLIPDDSFSESGETVKLVLSNPTGAALGSPNAATLTIADNDSPNITPVQRTFRAVLSGANEVPPNATTGSGVGLVQLAADEASAKVTLSFVGLTGPANAGHIHGPAAPGTNAPVIFPFSGLPAATAGTLNNVTINPSPTQVQQLKTGQFYMNLHTAANPGGEIRGQLFYNAIDESSMFVREHYYDFLNRTPDSSGLAFWINEIDSCGANMQCIEAKRINVSAAFFLSGEFQQTGFFVYRVRRAALGLQPSFGQYTIDKSMLGAGTEANKTAFAEAFVQSPDFLAKYPSSQNGSDFIDALIATIQAASGVNLTPRRPDLVNEYLLGVTQAQSRARVIRKAIEYSEYTTAEFNPAFVLSEYFGYLRRDPDAAGYAFWLTKLNNFTQAGDDPLVRVQKSEMVKAFLDSSEYRQRFGSN
jgi:uncharacterized protein (TIGR03118 family)